MLECSEQIWELDSEDDEDCDLRIGFSNTHRESWYIEGTSTLVFGLNACDKWIKISPDVIETSSDFFDCYYDDDFLKALGHLEDDYLRG